mmetsp:Transcript_23377/g.73166  ORF Transcript_23377/g.73166 Transcript_23377/m.73166 type:complete len:459 (-) Transcript_23377:97-1473(-)
MQCNNISARAGTRLARVSRIAGKSSLGLSNPGEARVGLVIGMPSWKSSGAGRAPRLRARAVEEPYSAVSPEDHAQAVKEAEERMNAFLRQSGYGGTAEERAVVVDDIGAQARDLEEDRYLQEEKDKFATRLASQADEREEADDEDVIELLVDGQVKTARKSKTGIKTVDDQSGESYRIRKEGASTTRVYEQLATLRTKYSEKLSTANRYNRFLEKTIEEKVEEVNGVYNEFMMVKAAVGALRSNILAVENDIKFGTDKSTACAKLESLLERVGSMEESLEVRTCAAPEAMCCCPLASPLPRRAREGRHAGAPCEAQGHRGGGSIGRFISKRNAKQGPTSMSGPDTKHPAMEVQFDPACPSPLPFQERMKGIDAVRPRVVTVTWNGMAEDVMIMGSFDGWTRGESLSPDNEFGGGNNFTTELVLSPGCALYSYGSGCALSPAPGARTPFSRGASSRPGA